MLLKPCVKNTVFPDSFTENGINKGIDYDMVLEAGKRMHIQINVEYFAWRRMLSSIENGICDAGSFLGERKGSHCMIY